MGDVLKFPVRESIDVLQNADSISVVEPEAVLIPIDEDSMAQIMNQVWYWLIDEETDQEIKYRLSLILAMNFAEVNNPGFSQEGYYECSKFLEQRNLNYSSIHRNNKVYRSELDNKSFQDLVDIFANSHKDQWLTKPVYYFLLLEKMEQLLLDEYRTDDKAMEIIIAAVKAEFQ